MELLVSVWKAPGRALHLYVRSYSAILWVMRSFQSRSIGTRATGRTARSRASPLPKSKRFFAARRESPPDLRHAHLEDRLIAVGRTAQGRPLFVAFTIRERFRQPTIRPVTARYMHEREARNYEAQGSEDDH